jgi:hypothetical protein
VSTTGSRERGWWMQREIDRAALAASTLTFSPRPRARSGCDTTPASS